MLIEDIGRMRPQVFILCYSDYYRPSCVSSDGRNFNEVRLLVSQGVKEFQVIAQELTYYGVDLYKKQMLPELIEKMAKFPGVEWIRLHYAYPAAFPEDLFRVMREHDNTTIHGYCLAAYQ